MLSRFVWWVQNDPTAVVVSIQCFSSVVTIVITGILCWVTYCYMMLTRELVLTAQKQLRESVRPVIAVYLRFGGAQNSYGEDIFRDRTYVTISNQGTLPLVVQRVLLGWDHSDKGAWVEKELPGFRNIVMNPSIERQEDCWMVVDNIPPSVEHFDSWSDFVSVTVWCSDLGGASPVSYIYQRATDLRLGA
jgi:hypothetical protein